MKLIELREKLFELAQKPELNNDSEVVIIVGRCGEHKIEDVAHVFECLSNEHSIEIRCLPV